MSDRADLLTTSQVAHARQVSARTVLRMALEGDLPYVMKLPTKTGGYLFDPDLVERVFAARDVERDQNKVPEQQPA